MRRKPLRLQHEKRLFQLAVIQGGVMYFTAVHHPIIAILLALGWLGLAVKFVIEYP